MSRRIQSQTELYQCVRSSCSVVVEDKSVNEEGRKCLFNDALNTFYLRLYGVRHG